MRMLNNLLAAAVLVSTAGTVAAQTSASASVPPPVPVPASPERGRETDAVADAHGAVTLWTQELYDRREALGANPSSDALKRRVAEAEAELQKAYAALGAQLEDRNAWVLKNVAWADKSTRDASREIEENRFLGWGARNLGQAFDDVVALKTLNNACRNEVYLRTAFDRNAAGTKTDELQFRCAMFYADRFAADYSTRARGRQAQSNIATGLSTISATALLIASTANTPANTKEIWSALTFIPLVAEDVRQTTPRSRLYSAATGGLQNLTARYRDMHLRLDQHQDVYEDALKRGEELLPACKEVTEWQAAMKLAPKNDLARSVIEEELGPVAERCATLATSTDAHGRLSRDFVHRHQRLGEDALSDVGDVVSRVEVLDSDLNLTPFEGVRTVAAMPFKKIADIIGGDTSSLKGEYDVDGRRYTVALRIGLDEMVEPPAALDALPPRSALLEEAATKLLATAAGMKKPGEQAAKAAIERALKCPQSDSEKPSARCLTKSLPAYVEKLNVQAVRLNKARERALAIKASATKPTIDLHPSKIAKEQAKATQPQAPAKPGETDAAPTTTTETQPPAPTGSN